MFDRRQKINLLCALVCAGMLGYAIYAEKYLGLRALPAVHVPAGLRCGTRPRVPALGAASRRYTAPSSMRD